MIRKGTSDNRNRSSDNKNRPVGRPCAGCGKIIESGLYCSVCLEKFRERAKTQGKRIEAMKSNALRKVAQDRHESVILIAINDDRNLNLTKIILERGLTDCNVLATNNTLNLDADYNGLDMLARIRGEERFKGVPVMIMSGSTQRDLVASVFSLGVQDYVTKPCSPNDLVDRVNKMLTKAEESTADSKSKNAFHILLVDDDIFDLRQERDTLQNRLPCEITTVQSAVEGMKVLENRRADLILVSLDMPFVNGLKFLSMVTANPKLKNIPVIIMTDTRDFKILSEIDRSAAAGYVRKPNISKDELNFIESKLRRRK